VFHGYSRNHPLAKSNCFLADLDTALMQQISHIPKRQRKPHVWHHRQTDDFWTALKALERVRPGDVETLRGLHDRLNRNLSDKSSKSIRVFDSLSQFITATSIFQQKFR
jgi:hypothetical protein